MTVRTILLVVGLAAAAPAMAQTPEPEAPPSPELAAMPAAIPVGSRVGIPTSGYDDGGRRDPFASLVQTRRPTATVTLPNGRPRRGLAAMALADVTVRGIVRNGSKMLAIIEGPNRQSYVARQSDQLLDATIESIDASGVVFAELVDGGMPPSHVRKSLRAAGEELR